MESINIREVNVQCRRQIRGGVSVNAKDLVQAIAANIAAGATLTDAMEAAIGCKQYDKMVAVLLGAIQQGRDKITLSEIMEDICE